MASEFSRPLDMVGISNFSIPEFFHSFRALDEEDFKYLYETIAGSKKPANNSIFKSAPDFFCLADGKFHMEYVEKLSDNEGSQEVTFMGITFLKLKVSNPARPGKSKDYEFLVDSGAVYSVLPKEVLKRLGIKPTSYEEFTLANGETIRSPVGNAYFEYRGKIRAAPVIFGEKGIYLLGATTLEALGMILDPIRRELRPLPMVLMYIRFHAESSLLPAESQRLVNNLTFKSDPNAYYCKRMHSRIG